MNFSKQAIDLLTQVESGDGAAQEDSSLSSSKQESLSPSRTPKPAPSPVFLALKGYSLFKHHVKLEAIVNFLKLSSYDPIFTSGDITNLARIEAMCEEPKLILKGMKGAVKYPSTWTTNFCARFICDAVELIEQDQKLSDSKTSSRKSPRNIKRTLPPAACTLISMVKQARLKVKGESISRKRKTTSKVKTVQDYLIKSTVHNPEFVEITSDQILDYLTCPICNHRSLVSVTTKEEAELSNKLIRETFESKLNQWTAGGKKGSRPRMGRTESQVLGCVCFMQNCIGNSDGSGCFKCKTLQGNVCKEQDKG